jgi:hypothetical protein
MRYLTAKVEVNTNAWREATEASLEKVKADREVTEVYQENIEAAVHSTGAWRRETTACEETTEACQPQCRQSPRRSSEKSLRKMPE